jgi:hypothetical protein
MVYLFWRYGGYWFRFDPFGEVIHRYWQKFDLAL